MPPAGVFGTKRTGYLGFDLHQCCFFDVALEFVSHSKARGVQMQNRSVLKRHAVLVDQMAETLGVDLEEVAMRGDLQIEEISDAVLSCTACANPEACQGWLGEHKNGAPQTPDYCRNSELLQRLQKGILK